MGSKTRSRKRHCRLMGVVKIQNPHIIQKL
jgi:hypothetical protein